MGGGKIVGRHAGERRGDDLHLLLLKLLLPVCGLRAKALVLEGPGFRSLFQMQTLRRVVGESSFGALAHRPLPTTTTTTTTTTVAITASQECFPFSKEPAPSLGESNRSRPLPPNAAARCSIGRALQSKAAGRRGRRPPLSRAARRSGALRP